MPSVDAAAKINRHASDLVVERSVAAEVRSEMLNRIAVLSLIIFVLQCTDFVGPLVGAATLLNIPLMWLTVSMMVAGVAVAIQHMVKKRVHKTKGEFVLKYDVNVPIRLSALQHWLRRQLFVQVRSAMYFFEHHICMHA
jgi:hypothetical protein